MPLTGCFFICSYLQGLDDGDGGLPRGHHTISRDFFVSVRKEPHFLRSQKAAAFCDIGRGLAHAESVKYLTRLHGLALARLTRNRCESRGRRQKNLPDALL